MIAVIFELTPYADETEHYFAQVASLKSALENIEGFISVERFASVTTPGKFVSLSFWKDEATVARWRNLVAHREAQALGRAEIFQDYRLRVAHVVRDYGLDAREQAPSDSRQSHS
jgi:heme-degrading monooxygenase HmoA